MLKTDLVKMFAWSLSLVLQSCAEPAPHFTLWAWESSHDLRFVPAEVDVAILAAEISVRSHRLTVRPRSHPVLLPAGKTPLAVDDIVPQLFRLGHEAAAWKSRFARQGKTSCGDSLGISTDEPVNRIGLAFAKANPQHALSPELLASVVVAYDCSESGRFVEPLAKLRRKMTSRSLRASKTGCEIESERRESTISNEVEANATNIDAS